MSDRSEFDYSDRTSSVLVAEIRMWQAYSESGQHEALLVYYRLHLESALSELAKRNLAEIARRAAEKLS